MTLKMLLIKKFVVMSLLAISGFAQAIEPAATKAVDSKVLAGSGLSDPNMAGSLIQTTLGLLVILAVIGGAAWAFKRFGNFQTGVQGKLKVVGGISLSSRERIVLLQVGSQQLVIGVAPGQIQTLHVLDEPLPTDDESENTPSFSAKLQSAMAKHVVKKTDGHESVADQSDGRI